MHPRPLARLSLVVLLLPPGLAVAASFACIRDSESNIVSVIDFATNSVVGAPILAGIRPHGVAVSPPRRSLHFGIPGNSVADELLCYAIEHSNAPRAETRPSRHGYAPHHAEMTPRQLQLHSPGTLLPIDKRPNIYRLPDDRPWVVGGFPSVRESVDAGHGVRGNHRGAFEGRSTGGAHSVPGKGIGHGGSRR